MSDNALYWGGRTSANDRVWATIAHLSVFIGLPLLGPILIHLIAGRRVYIRYHAVQAISLHVVLLLVGALGFLTCGLGWVLGAIGALIPFYGAFLALTGAWTGYPLVSGFGKE